MQSECGSYFAENLTKLLARLKKEVPQFAKDIGVDRTTAYAWTKNKALPNGQILDRIAVYFGCTVGALMSKGMKVEYKPTFADAIEIINEYRGKLIISPGEISDDSREKL